MSDMAPRERTGEIAREYFLDNASTTPVPPPVAQAMADAATFHFGNPSSVHRRGVQASLLVEKARAGVGKLLGAASEEIIFTSGGTEANHLAILGTLFLRPRGELILSRIEHPSSIQAAEFAGTFGYNVRWLGCDSLGRIAPGELRRIISSDTRLVSVQYANNELGTMQPIGELAGICEERGVPFHCDATQVFGKIPFSVRDFPGLKMLTVSAHKIGGPKGCGALYLRAGTPLRSLLGGGGQEHGHRAGTENVPGIAGFGKAVELIDFSRLPRMKALRDRLATGLDDAYPGASVNGDPIENLGTILSLTLPGCSAKDLLFALSREGIFVSTGSACASGKTTPSHVLTAIGLSPERAQETIRVSFGAQNTEADLQAFLAAIVRHGRRAG